jgi:hypothetical protein
MGSSSDDRNKLVETGFSGSEPTTYKAREVVEEGEREG